MPTTVVTRFTTLTASARLWCAVEMPLSRLVKLPLASRRKAWCGKLVQWVGEPSVAESPTTWSELPEPVKA
jgi:hypothetical protein